MTAIRTDRTDCECGARTILARDVPPLNWERDPAGTFAARHLATGGWAVRPYQPGMRLEPLEFRHSKHECP